MNAIIFCVNLASYDMMLAEDEKTNQLMDSLALFGRVCNNRWLNETPIVLLLNKSDLFRKKLLYSPLTSCFTEYNGHDNYEDACSYIQTKFADLNKSERPNEVFTHFTCALDTEDIEGVFLSVIDAIIGTPFSVAPLQKNIEGCEIC